MAADEAAVAAGGGTDGALRRADVGDHAPLRGEREHLAHDVRQLGDRCCDDDEVGAVDRLRERRRRLDGLPLVRDPEHVGIGIPAAHRGARAPGGERGGRADQARPDDGDVPEHGRR